jgi:hypothetical protein
MRSASKFHDSAPSFRHLLDNAQKRPINKTFEAVGTLHSSRAMRRATTCVSPLPSYANGLDVVALPPLDHPHHKGLQYGLCAEDVNFWEEGADPDNRRIGRQETQSIAPLASGEAIGFRQQIVWRDDLCVSFTEARTLFVLKPCAHRL